MSATNLSMRRGEHKIWQMTITENGSAVSITGASIFFAARASYPASSASDDSDALLHKNTASGSGITITDGSAGIFQVEILHADTNSVTVAATTGDAYYYGVEYMPNGSTESRYVDIGQLTLYPDIVRAI